MFCPYLFAFAAFSKAANATDKTYTNNFLERIEGKVRYIVFDAPVGFPEAFIAQADPSVFDHYYQPDGYDHADLIVFFFNDWSEVRQIPGAENFGSIIDGVEKLGKKLAQTITVTASGAKGPRPVIFGFYNLKNLKGCSSELIAENIISDVIMVSQEGDKSVFGECNNR